MSIKLTRREVKALYAVLNVWCKCRESVLDHQLNGQNLFDYEDFYSVVDKVANELETTVSEEI